MRRPTLPRSPAAQLCLQQTEAAAFGVVGPHQRYMPDNYLWPSVGALVAFLQRPSAHHNSLTWVAYTCIKNEMLLMIITVSEKI